MKDPIPPTVVSLLTGWLLGSVFGALGILPPLPHPEQVWALVAASAVVAYLARGRWIGVLAIGVMACFYVWVIEAVTFVDSTPPHTFREVKIGEDAFDDGHQE